MTITTIGREIGRTAGMPFVPGYFGKIAGRVGSFISRSRVEQQLEQLDDRLLLDIGVKRSDIRRMVWGA